LYGVSKGHNPIEMLRAKLQIYVFNGADIGEVFKTPSVCIDLLNRHCRGGCAKDTRSKLEPLRSLTTFLSPLEKLCCYQSGNISIRRGEGQPLRAVMLPARVLTVKKSPRAFGASAK